MSLYTFLNIELSCIIVGFLVIIVLGVLFMSSQDKEGRAHYKRLAELSAHKAQRKEEKQQAEWKAFKERQEALKSVPSKTARSEWAEDRRAGI